MSGLSADVRQAVRSLFRNRLSTLIIVLSLGLAVGVTTATYCFLDAVLLKPLPYNEPHELVLLWASKTEERMRGISAPDLADLRMQNHVFEDLVPLVTYAAPLNVRTVNNNETMANGQYVGRGFFSLLGVRPYLGRTFRFQDESVDTDNVAIVSHSFWKSQLGEQQDVIGKTLVLNSDWYTVVGVMPPGFFFLDHTVQIWLPLTSAMLPRDRGFPKVHAIARLKPKVTIAQAQKDIDLIVRRLASEYPETDKDLSIGLFPLLDRIVGKFRTAFWALLGGMLFLLLVACANIAHLLLARGVSRNTEISIRIVLGASRWAIFRQFLVESLLLGLGGGFAAILSAFWGVDILRGLNLAEIPRFAEANIDVRGILFALATSLLASTFVGLLSALRASQLDLLKPLKTGGTGPSYGSRSHLRDLLVVSEVAFAFVLMTAAGLLFNSFLRLARIDWGFRAENLLVLDVMLGREKSWSIVQNMTFADQTISKLKALPGVQSVALGRGSPIKGLVGGPGIVIVEELKWVSPRKEVVGPGYFETLGIPLLRGRGFAESDGPLAPKVAVVDRRLTAQVWPGQNPVGKRLFILSLKREIRNEVDSLVGSSKLDESELLKHVPKYFDEIPYEVIGEVGAVLSAGPLPIDSSSIYLDYRQRPDDMPMISASFFLRTSNEPSTLAGAAREIIKGTDSEVTILHIDTMEERVRGAIGDRGSTKLFLVISTVGSGLGLLLAALGIHGAMAHATTLRTKEIGVRMALGAQRGEIFRMVLGLGLRVTVAGLLLGVAGALATTRMLAGSLFGVSPTDPLTFAVSAVALLAVALFACYWPARRALRLEPMSALRYE